MGKYDDIINLPRPDIIKHQRASLISRAAQFGAFRALDGHEAKVNEAARQTDSKLELSDNVIEILNQKIMMLKAKIYENPKVYITYFVPDEKKSGGKYIKLKGNIRKIDDFKRMIVLEDKTEIYMEDILEIESNLFDYSSDFENKM